MSAIVLGKRSFFEEINNSSSSSSTSSVSKSKRTRFFSSCSSSHLASLFPDMDQQVLESALEECGEDLDSAIKSLNQLRLGTLCLLLTERLRWMVQSGWSFVREMTSASDMDDARARASRALEALEKSICAREAAKNSSHQESTILKEQVQLSLQENAILKCAVAIQHERQKESDHRSQESQQLKQLVARYQEQVRTLEVNNYALTMHLKQAEQNSSIPGHFHPDVFWPIYVLFVPGFSEGKIV